MSDYYTPPKLEDLDLSPGKRVRLRRLLYDYGPGNGYMQLLPVDQGFEHGPVDFFENPDSKHPDYQFTLAREGNFSGIAVQYGIAQKYIGDYAGEVPLVVKLNGKSNVPPDDEALSPLHATVEDAVRLGADAVGYTFYHGTPNQQEHIRKAGKVRRACDRYGMPFIIWAYPRGRDIEKKGGRDSFYAVDYAARFAQELGADVVKVAYPEFDPEKDQRSPSPYDKLTQPDREGGPISRKQALRQIVESAGKSLVIMSGGSKRDDEQLMVDVREALEAGASGFIFGRNIWQRPMDEALDLTGRIQAEIDRVAE